MPRKYTKKSKYWDQFNTASSESTKSLNDLINSESGSEPISEGQSFYESVASCRTRSEYSGSVDGGNTYKRSNSITSTRKSDRYNNISEGGLPYDYKTSYVSPRESIFLCQKAYANIAIFRNAIDVMAEFSNSELHIKGGSEKARKFIERWLEKIQIWKIKDQYFREYYRSGNVFMYKIDGKFTSEDLIKLNQIYGNESKAAIIGKIPVSYTFLNPYDFVATRSLSYKDSTGGRKNHSVYKKLLSEYDLERLKNPKTLYDKEIFRALDPETKEKIKKGSYTRDGVKISIDPKKLIYSFYKKQDYEPFAIPFGFPVLDDLNWKLELKKVDQAITRTIENVILLITMGAEPDKGGINQNNLAAMQNLFRNQSIGRALIADWTTKAEFVIPDMNKVLGSEKYKIVNEDIKEGLQNIIVGKENYSSTQVKAQIFLERLKEARNTFLNDFLKPQIKDVCRKMGFRVFPNVEFIEIDIKDEVQLQRIATRLIELGIITPEQGMTAIKKGIYPDKEELDSAQDKFVDQRRKGHYVPVISNQNLFVEEEEEDPAQKKKQSSPNQAGRPTGSSPKGDAVFASEEVSAKKIQQTIYDIESLTSNIESKLRKKYSKKRLNKQQKEMAQTLCEQIIISTDKDMWEKSAQKCIEDHIQIEKLKPLKEIIEISESKDLLEYPSAILYHSQ